MHDAHGFLQTLALVLCTAAATAVLFRRLRQPVVLGYLLAGMFIGSRMAVPFLADGRSVQTLAELGVVLLMFCLGIEFNLSKLLNVGRTAAFVAVVQCSLMIWLGYVLGQLFGWTRLQSLFSGAMIAISSTTIVVKAFREHRETGEFTQIVFGILIVQDLIAILLIAMLTALSAGGGLSALDVARTTGRLAAFLTVSLILGLLVVPRLVRAVDRLDQAETTAVASVGIAFGFAALAAAFGYSVALGAFLAGALVAESGAERRIAHVVEPVRDIFVAIFFVSVGMLIDPAEIAAQWVTVLVFLVVVIVGMICSITVGAFLTGQSVQTSVRTGMSLAQIGEFSFIIAEIGTSSGAVDERLYSIAVAVSAITAMLTPWFVRAAGPAAAWVDKTLPRSLQTFGALYSSWLDQLSVRATDRHSARIRRAVRWLVVDAVVVAGVVIGASVELDRITELVKQHLDLATSRIETIVIAAAVIASAPFLIAIVGVSRFLGFELATRVFPSAGHEIVDLAAAPRRLLVVTLQLAIVLLVGAPLIAITQPFVPPFRGAAVLIVVLAGLAVPFWRSAANLQGHARAAAQAIAESIARQVRRGRQPPDRHWLDDANQVFAGLGSPVPVVLPPGSEAVGKTLAQFQLRGLTGATVLAIQRSDTSVLIPTGHERLLAGDVLAIAGNQEAIAAARRLLLGDERCDDD